MARQLRIQYPGAFYHVTGRGNERQDIYRDKDDYVMFLEKLSDSLEVYNVSLLGYVCMTNHYHLLVMTPEGNLSSFMRHFNIAYTLSFNRRHNRSGHLYQGRYKSYLIDADGYLKEVSRYVHLNPVRIKKYAGMETDQRIRILNNFTHSSFAGYTNTKKRDDFVHYHTIPEKLIDAFCQLTGSDRNEICRRGKNSTERSMLMELLYRFCNIKQPEIGRYLGNIDYSAVSISRKRLRLKIAEDLSLKQKFDGLVSDLSRIKI